MASRHEDREQPQSLSFSLSLCFCVSVVCLFLFVCLSVCARSSRCSFTPDDPAAVAAARFCVCLSVCLSVAARWDLVCLSVRSLLSVFLPVSLSLSPRVFAQYCLAVVTRPTPLHPYRSHPLRSPSSHLTSVFFPPPPLLPGRDSQPHSCAICFFVAADQPAAVRGAARAH